MTRDAKDTFVAIETGDAGALDRALARNVLDTTPSLTLNALSYEQDLLVYVVKTREAQELTLLVRDKLSDGWEVVSHTLGIDDHQIVLSVLVRRLIAAEE